MFNKKKFYLLIVLSLILVVVGCSSDSDDYVDEQAHGLTVAIELPQESSQTQEVGVLTIEEHTTFEEVQMTLKDSDGEQVDSKTVDVSDGDERVDKRFEDIKAGQEYDVEVELLGIIRDEEEIRTLYDGSATSPEVEPDAFVNVNVDVEPLNADSLTVSISGDEYGVSEVRLEHPSKDLGKTKSYEGESIVFADNLELISARWDVIVYSEGGEEAEKEVLLLPSEDKEITLDVDIDLEGNMNIVIDVFTSPDSPGNLRIEDDELVWDEVGGAEAYRVYKTESEGEEISLAEETVLETIYSDIESGYYYWVRAYVDGYSSGLSESIYYEEDESIDVDPEMVLVEAGTTSEDNGEITVGNDFYIGKYHITQAEFEEVMGFNPSYFNDDDHPNLTGDSDYRPVERVSWYDAVKYTNKLSEIEGLDKYYEISDMEYDGDSIESATVVENSNANGYRLPTKKEWLYSARGGEYGEPTTYAGSNNLDEVGWYKDNSDEANSDRDSNQGTMPVGEKEPNELGLYDMNGNVFDLTSEDFDRDIYTQKIGYGSYWDSSVYSEVDHWRNFITSSNVYNAGFRLARNF